MAVRFTIEYDDTDIDPRREFTQYATLVCAAGRHDLGDREPTENELRAAREGGIELLERYLRRWEDALYVLPLALLDHSGLTLYVGTRAHWCDPGGWDSGPIGFAYTTRPQAVAAGFTDLDATVEVEEQLGPLGGTVKVQKNVVLNLLEAEIREYAAYVGGEVYAFLVGTVDDDAAEGTDPDEPYEGRLDEVLDSCGGFIGDRDYVLAEAREARNYAEQQWLERVRKAVEV